MLWPNYRVNRGCVVLEEEEVVGKLGNPLTQKAPHTSTGGHHAAESQKVCCGQQNVLGPSGTMLSWSNSATRSSDREGRMPGATAVSQVLCQQLGHTPISIIRYQGCYNHLGSSQPSLGLDRLQPTRGMDHFSTLHGQCIWMQHLLTLASCVCSLFFTSVSSAIRALKARLVLVNCLHIWSDKVSNRCSASSRSRMELARMF